MHCRTEGTASAKVLRWEHAWFFGRARGSPVWPESSDPRDVLGDEVREIRRWYREQGLVGHVIP